jgi:hypothetical protein
MVRNGLAECKEYLSFGALISLVIAKMKRMPPIDAPGRHGVELEPDGIRAARHGGHTLSAEFFRSMGPGAGLPTAGRQAVTASAN